VLITGGTSRLAGAMSAALGMGCRTNADGVAAARDAFGGIDVLVNNAGIGMQTVNPLCMTNPRRLWTVQPDRFRDLVTTNVTGYFLLTRAVVPTMVGACFGKVINVSINESTTRRAGFTPTGPSAPRPTPCHT
jgi:NAD(P)-dependent dehydrogenase (short-subunit alcohol dehydrogenase family)